MTPETWVLLGHLAGAVCCSTLSDDAGRPITYASRAACEAAGERWLASVRYRSPNDFYECIERRER